MFCLITELFKTVTVFVLLSIGCVIRLKVCEFCVFDNEITICHDGSELVNWNADIILLLSMTIDVATTPANKPVDTLSIESCQTSRIRCDSICVSSPTKMVILIESEKQTKYESCLFAHKHQCDTRLSFDPFRAEIT